MSDLQWWFWQNDLLLNPNKSEVCCIDGFAEQLYRLPCPLQETALRCARNWRHDVTLDFALSCMAYATSVTVSHVTQSSQLRAAWSVQGGIIETPCCAALRRKCSIVYIVCKTNWHALSTMCGTGSLCRRYVQRSSLAAGTE